MRFSPAFLALALSSSLAAQVPTVTRKLVIGCEGCGDASQFGTIWDVSVSARGDVLVTDKDAPMLRLFDANGRKRWAVGAKGKGPGEYLLPYRSTLTDFGVVVVDMTNSRVTDLSMAGAIVGTTPLLNFAVSVGVNARGEMIFGMDNRRAFTIARRPPEAAALENVAEFPGSMKNKAVAVAPNGSMAVMLDGEKYEIVRLDAAGKTVGTITREIERPRRTAAEEVEYRQRLNRDIAMMSAEAKKQGLGGNLKAPDIPPEQRGLKSHLTVDGLRFDSTNRLWVYTQRGDETKTVFDLFSPAGAFLGSITIPQRITSYSIGGSYLVTAGENEDGVPVVMVWTVK